MMASASHAVLLMVIVASATFQACALTSMTTPPSPKPPPLDEMQRFQAKGEPSPRHTFPIPGSKQVMVCELINGTHHHSLATTTASPENLTTDSSFVTEEENVTESPDNCQECPPSRGTNYVCASDGLMYPSVCHVQFMACLGHNITVLHQATGDCSFTDNSTSSVCEFECLQNDVPVCGSDNITYPSLCHLEKAAACGEALVELAQEGPCVEVSSEQCPLVCADQNSSQPVCGSDGVTYTSECLLTSSRVCHGHHVHLAHQGPCKRTNDCPQTCPVVRAPVCGSDSLTYLNSCLLRASTCGGSGVRFVHSGHCESKEVPECRNETQEVCGSDGVTYPSECHLKRAVLCDGIIAMPLHIGTCIERRRDSGGKICCPDDMRPLCGSDGRTYTNLCYMKEAMRCEGHYVVVMHPGPCELAKEQNLCPPPFSVSQPSCPFRQDTCFSCRDCALKGQLCCSDGCSFHCTDSVGY